MKAWLKDGLIGAGIGLIIVIISLVSFLLFPVLLWVIIGILVILSLPTFILGLILIYLLGYSSLVHGVIPGIILFLTVIVNGFVMGIFIGWIVRKRKLKRENL